MACLYPAASSSPAAWHVSVLEVAGEKKKPFRVKESINKAAQKYNSFFDVACNPEGRENMR